MDHYNLETWRCVPGMRDTLVFRPSLITLGYRLVITVLMALGVYVLFQTEELPAGLAGGLAGVCCLAGLIAPLSVLWQSVRIQRDIHNNLEIRRRGLFGWSNVQQWPLNELEGIFLSAREVYQRKPRRRVGWRWHVTIPVRLLEPDNLRSGFPPVIHFWRCMQKSRPMGRGMLPKEVVELVDGLEQLTGLTCDRTRVDIGYSKVGGSAMETSAPMTTTVRHTFRSLDEVPPELRGRIEAMMAETQSTDTPYYREVKSTRITIRDSSGQMQTYNSVEEMPPEVRQRYESMIRRRQQPPK